MALGRLLILYDGKCPFCLRWVHRLLAADRFDKLRFASLQSDWTRAFLESQGLVHPGMGSILVWDEEERLHVNSAALIRITRELPRPWSWLRHLRLLPLVFRDSIYAFIGRHRYAWFGRHDTCRIPFSADERKFLDLNDPVYKDAEHADLSQNTADPDQR